jgi:LPS O-antigen subunit length determinant protein (WzzB/FepE family)
VRRSLVRAILPALIGALVAAFVLFTAQSMARRRRSSAP